MTFAERLQRKIERKAVRSELGGKVVYLKKGSAVSWLPLGIGDWFSEWKQIRPPVDENGKILWANLLIGGWRNFWKLVMVLVFAGMVYLGFNEVFTYIEYIMDMPCVQTCIELAEQTPAY